MPQTFLGLDISQNTLKAVVLNRKGLSGGFISDARILNINACGGIDAALKKLAENESLLGLPCCLALSSSQWMFRHVLLPFRDEDKIRKTLPFEVEPLIPLPVEEITTDYVNTHRSGLLVAALPKNTVKMWIERIEAHLGTLHILDASAAVLTLQLLDSKKTPESGVLMDVGQDASHVAFFENNSLVNLRSFPLGGEDITEALAQDLSVPRDKAEALKMSIAEQAPGAKTVEACRRFCLELKKTFHYLKLNGLLQNEPVRIFLTGGGALFKPLRKELESVLPLPIEPLDCVQLKQLEVDKTLRPHFDVPLMNTAVAAALRFLPVRKSFNMRQGEFAVKNTGGNFKQQFKKAAVLSGILVALFLLIQAADYAAKSKRLDLLKKEIAFVLKKNLPDANPRMDSLQQLKLRLEERKKIFAVHENLPEATVLILLKDISELIPPAANVVITTWNLENKTLSLQGEAQTMETITSIKNELSKSKYFKEVTLGPTQGSPQTQKVDFNIRMDLP